MEPKSMGRKSLPKGMEQETVDLVNHFLERNVDEGVLH